MGFKDKHYKVGFIKRSKNNDFPVYFSRTPLFFRDCQNLSRGIYFANFFAWMGKVREAATFPILAKISEDLNTGKLGMVTNSVSIDIVGEAIAGDIIETRFWIGKTLDNGSTFDLFYDWKKLLPDGTYEELAYGEMRVSWVEIVSHGIVKSKPLPSYFQDYAKIFQSPVDNPYIFALKDKKNSLLNLGEELYNAPPSPRRGVVLAEETISTTLEDANSVGNIYFSNYGRWQGLVRDRYFYNIDKEYFHGIGEKGELIVLNASINHLRESMPFDKILITMNIVRLWETGAELTFSYYKIDDTKVKLAIGVQRVIWAKKENKDNFKPQHWPKIFLNKLLTQ